MTTRGDTASFPRELFRPRRAALASLVVSLVALALAVGLGVAIGAVPIPPGTILRLLVGRTFGVPAPDEIAKYSTIIFSLRLPRVALMCVAGAALSAAGAAYQGLFRNPLADPYLVGVASGAGLGATLVISIGLPLVGVGLFAVPLGAFLGGVLAVSAVGAIARTGRTMPVSTVLLAGVAIGSIASAVTTFWMLRSPDGLRRAFSWLLGGYSAGGWAPVLVVLPFLVIGLAVLRFYARSLNILQLDEEQATQLGVNVERLKLTLIGAATLMTAAAVSFGGLIGFVGLVVPHIMRMLGGPDYRRLIPLSAIGGGAFLIASDLLARTVFAPQELPVGVITAMTGAPFFLFLLRRVKTAAF